MAYSFRVAVNRRTALSTLERTAAAVALLAALATTLSATIVCDDYPGRGQGELADVYPYESFRQELRGVRDVNSALKVVEWMEPNYGSGDLARVRAIDSFVRLRFKHGYSQLTFCQDWAANLIGHVWWHLRSPVDPDAILKYSWGGCSQQSIVAQELAARSGIEYLTVRQPAHFASAMRAEGNWYLVDPDLEPRNDPPLKLQDLLSGRRSDAYFRSPAVIANQRLGLITTVGFNQYPAPRAHTLQYVTGFLSRFGFLFAATTWWLLRRRRLGHRYGRSKRLGACHSRPSDQSTAKSSSSIGALTN